MKTFNGIIPDSDIKQKIKINKTYIGIVDTKFETIEKKIISNAPRKKPLEISWKKTPNKKGGN